MNFKNLNLNLISRIEDQIRNIITSKYCSIKSLIINNNSVKIIKNSLYEKMKSCEGQYGINHYYTAIYRAFYTSDFIDDMYEEFKSD